MATPTQNRITVVINHAEVTGDTTTTEWFTHPSKTFILESAKYYNATGLAGHASNYFNVAIKVGSTVLANWSTSTAAESTIAADTWVTMTLGAALEVAAGSSVVLLLDETGTSDLPAGKIVLHGRYV